MDLDSQEPRSDRVVERSDVTFSFLAEDEALARRLPSRIEQRLDDHLTPPVVFAAFLSQSPRSLL